MNKRIWLSSPHMGDKEREFVNEAFDTNWIAPVGPHIEAFEQDVANYLGEGVHVAALQSGTSALHLALVLLGVGQGDEVICQSMTFAASANPIVYAGAAPVFVDSERDTWNMDPLFLELAIIHGIEKGRKPKAIIVVHLYGMPANMKEIMRIARSFSIPVIEDAAEALGAMYRGSKAGTLGDLAILSFNGNKIITTSGGGALVGRNEDWISRARFLATQARDPAPHYEHSTIGFNYRISNVCAAIGRGQMFVLPERVVQRRINYSYYYGQLAGVPGVEFLVEPSADYFPNRWLTAILLKDFKTRERIRQHLAALNIESRPLWKPMHLQPVFRHFPYYGTNVAAYLFERGLCLPSGSNLTPAELKSVADEVKRGLTDVGSAQDNMDF